MESTSQKILTPMLSGGVAGLTVDIVLFPIDTVKTRLQAAAGFRASGGFSGIYRGLGAVAAGSVPTAALFFLSYEAFKGAVEPLVEPKYTPLVHMVAASVGEVVACIIRVPTEIAKQRQQAASLGPDKPRPGGVRILLEAYRSEGLRRGLYRGFFSTILRDLPFSLVQFPLWEALKGWVAEGSGGHISSLQVAMCGSISGAVSGALTTPLDAAKTRIMLAEGGASLRRLRVRTVLRQLHAEAGLRGLFVGLTPRVAAFTLGGFVFFGAYDYARNVCGYMFSA